MEIIINNKKIDIDIANTFFKRFRGLMGKKEINKGLFFKNTKAIHTFFMKEKIDLLIIDKKMNTIYFKRNLGKNKIVRKKKAYYIIELPSNSIPDDFNIDVPIRLNL